MPFSQDCAVASRSITKTIAAKLVDGETWHGTHLAESLGLSRDAVTKRISHFHDLKLIRHTRHGWTATALGQEILKRVIAEAPNAT
jgi:Mn-dependent DtxR family transcriptional regulator